MFERPDVDAAFLYRISGDMVARMRARMPRELVEKGDPVAEARYAIGAVRGFERRRASP